MKRTTFILAAILFSLGCIGTLYAFTGQEKQKPQEIRGIVVDNHDVGWYENQQMLWLQQAGQNPTDEHAWQQAFEAARYADMLVGEYGRTERKQAILDKMAANIPNSFAYNLCMYMTDINNRDATPQQYADKALQLIPDDICRKDAEVLIAYLWMSGKVFDDKSPEKAMFTQLVQKLYAGNMYPSYLLRYTNNSLCGMDGNAIYFVEGDVPCYTSIVLQEALGLHTDKIVIPVSFLYKDDFRKALCNRIGISDFEQKKDYHDIDNGVDIYFQDLLQYIIANSNLPVYFFPDGSYPETEEFKKNLYNEGLVFRYSTKRYDNMAVARRNVEKRYALEYLIEPRFVNEEQWQGSERIQLNYVVMLAPVVKSYRQDGDVQKANKLARCLTSVVMNTSLSDEERFKYLNLMEDKQK